MDTGIPRHTGTNTGEGEVQKPQHYFLLCFAGLEFSGTGVLDAQRRDRHRKPVFSGLRQGTPMPEEVSEPEHAVQRA